LLDYRIRVGTSMRHPRVQRWHELSPDDLLASESEFTSDDFTARRDAIDQHGNDWLIATLAGEVVGWIVVKWRGKSTHPEYPDLEDVWVSEQWRSQGVGTSLIRFAEGLATERGCARIGLAVNPTDNPRAHALYQRLGYEATGEAPYVDDVYDGKEDWAIDLEKPLVV
jgi:GNAT superfamily N-acetyltransferase